MATVIFLRTGVGPDRVVTGQNISILKILSVLGTRHPQFFPDIPTIATTRLDLTPFRDPEVVLVHVESSEVSGVFSAAGYYLLDGVTPGEASLW